MPSASPTIVVGSQTVVYVLWYAVKCFEVVCVTTSVVFSQRLLDNLVFAVLPYPPLLWYVCNASSEKEGSSCCCDN